MTGFSLVSRQTGPSILCYDLFWTGMNPIGEEASGNVRPVQCGQAPAGFAPPLAPDPPIGNYVPAPSPVKTAVDPELLLTVAFVEAPEFTVTSAINTSP